MSITVKAESPEIMTVRLTGKIGSQEWRDGLHKVAQLLQTRPSCSILVIGEDFAGWERGGWDDLAFERVDDRQINRMAIVAERQWEDAALLFAGKGLRRFEIEYFPPSELAKARAWLGETSEATSE